MPLRAPRSLEPVPSADDLAIDGSWRDGGEDGLVKTLFRLSVDSLGTHARPIGRVAIVNGTAAEFAAYDTIDLVEVGRYGSFEAAVGQLVRHVRPAKFRSTSRSRASH